MSSPELEPWQDPAAIDARAQRHYRNDLEFHDYPHAQDVAELAAVIAASALRHGAVIETAVLPAGGRLHDAGKHLRAGIDHPYYTAEEYAAAEGAKDLRALHMPEELIELTTDAIRSGDPDVPCANDTARCLMQGDLAAGGILDLPIVFLNGTYRLYKEDKRLKDEEPPTPTWDRQRLIEDMLRFGETSRGRLLAILEEDLGIGEHQRSGGGKNSFNREALKRVDLLRPDRLERILQAYMGRIAEWPQTSQPRILAGA